MVPYFQTNPHRYPKNIAKWKNIKQRGKLTCEGWFNTTYLMLCNCRDRRMKRSELVGGLECWIDMDLSANIAPHSFMVYYYETFNKGPFCIPPFSDIHIHICIYIYIIYRGLSKNDVYPRTYC